MGAGLVSRALVSAGLSLASEGGFRRAADNSGPRWSIALGDGYTFDIVQDVGGGFPTRDMAIDGVIRHLERNRQELTRSLKRARRMRSYRRSAAKRQTGDLS